MKKKLTLLGPIASIAALIITLFSMQVNSDSATTSGNNSPAILDTQGDVNVIYEAPTQTLSQPIRKKYFLEENNGGQPRVLKMPDTRYTHDASKQVCKQIVNGTEINLLGETASQFDYEVWRKIEILDGECAGNVGWVIISDIDFK